MHHHIPEEHQCINQLNSQNVPLSILSFCSWGMMVTTHPHLAPRIKKEYSYTATSPLGLQSRLNVKLHLYTFTRLSKFLCKSIPTSLLKIGQVIKNYCHNCSAAYNHTKLLPQTLLIVSHKMSCLFRPMVFKVCYSISQPRS